MSGIRLKYLLLPDLLSKSQLQDLKNPSQSSSLSSLGQAGAVAMTCRRRRESFGDDIQLNEAKVEAGRHLGVHTCE